MCCSALQCVAVCRSVYYLNVSGVQRVVVRRSVLQCVAVCCSILVHAFMYVLYVSSVY